MPKTIMALKDADCRFILDEKCNGQPLYCADAVIPGESYCPCHQRICYGAALPRKRNTVSAVGFDRVEVLDKLPGASKAGDDPQFVTDLVDALVA